MKPAGGVKGVWLSILRVTVTSPIFGVAGAVDMVMFYPAGKVMDRYRRSWVAIPSMLALGVAHLLLPLTSSVGTLLGAAVLMALGNGIGSGLVMTLGSDASPNQGRTQFLGVWRLTADVGTTIGPLLISGVTAVTALGPAVLTMGGIAVISVLLFRRWIPGRAAAP